jgi:NADH dehydrogenase/NADH:ubiquinone oxidoreductase subunit G
MGAKAAQAIGNAEFVVALSSYRNGTTDRAHVLLPIAPFTETAGTFVSMEGRVQSFNAVVKPLGDTRPGWKVLRMLGAMLGLAGFEAETIEACARGSRPTCAWARPASTIRSTRGEAGGAAAAALERIAEVGIYAGDPIVRRAPSLQKTNDAKACADRALQLGHARLARRSPRATAFACARAVARRSSRRASMPRCPKGACASRAGCARPRAWARARWRSRRRRPRWRR